MPGVSLPTIAQDGQIRSRMVGDSSGVDRRRTEEDLTLVRPAAPRQQLRWDDQQAKSRDCQETMPQNGRTTTMITITTISTVGTSLTAR
jgi:hypothetical protein